VTHHLEDIINRLQTANETQPTVLVGIDGRGGSGKTTLAGALAEAIRSAGRPTAIVHFDDFFFPSSERPTGMPETKPIGGDFDWRRLRDEVLLPLLENRLAFYTRYDWVLDALAEMHEVKPNGIAIVEGVYCTRRELADMYDIRVWVECPADIRLARGIRRDGETARSRWDLDWIPCEERYVRKHEPTKTAHFTIQGDAG
jgi:uridine kinase